MYNPFELNDYLGHLMVLGILGKVMLVALAIPAYKAYLNAQERAWKDKP